MKMNFYFHSTARGYRVVNRWWHSVVWINFCLIPGPRAPSVSGKTKKADCHWVAVFK